MALKSKQPPAGVVRGGKTSAGSTAGRPSAATQQGILAPVETIEERLERKAVVADRRALSSTSLGEMTKEQRHRLLYGD